MQITPLWCVTKILSCRVSITSRQGTRQLGVSFGSIFLPFFYKSRSNDADGDENVIKAIGFTTKTTTLHVHHARLYISLPVFTRL